MKTKLHKTSVVILLVVSLVPGLCGCCSENQSDCDNGLKLSPIYESTLWGALIGGIVGYQSDETGEGAAVGAAIFGVGELLKQSDRHHKEKEHKDKDECVEEVVVEIRNSNGSITPVELKKEGSIYIGPKGERYEQLPTEEQLKPIYGL
ncbi:MAG: glycine zipper family protein [Sedimentisphaerales bacterium]